MTTSVLKLVLTFNIGLLTFTYQLLMYHVLSCFKQHSSMCESWHQQIVLFDLRQVLLHKLNF